MSLELTIQNRQRTRRINTRLLRQIATMLLEDLLALETAELGITLVAASEMARVNWQFLQHEGSTDVITFDHTEQQISRRKISTARRNICGELFICVDDAVIQARSFQTSWPEELVRYIVHGVLHLTGLDDHQATARRQMKQEENRLVRLLATKFSFAQLARPKSKA